MRYRDNEVSLPAPVDSIDLSVAPGNCTFHFRTKSTARVQFFPNAPAENYVLHLSLSLKFPVRRCKARSNRATIELRAPFPCACFQADNGGLVMVTFYNYFVKCGPQASVSDVAEHIYYIRNLIGVDHIGVGGDFDGINKYVGEINSTRGNN